MCVWKEFLESITFDSKKDTSMIFDKNNILTSIILFEIKH